LAPPQLGRRRRAALDAIADTFAPGAVERGVPDAFLELFVSRLPKSEQARLSLLLGAFAARGFHRMSRERRERELLSWCDSRIALRGAGFHALRKGVLLLAWTLPGAPWDQLGYPGPLGRDPDARAKLLSPIVPDGQLDLDCDVCVIGSGAGGGPAVAVLAGAGPEVVVLEAGHYYGPPDFDGDELAGLTRMYRDAAAAASDDQRVGILAGSCLGGGTVINYTTAFRTPDTAGRQARRRRTRLRAPAEQPGRWGATYRLRRDRARPVSGRRSRRVLPAPRRRPRPDRPARRAARTP
jgi:long-chain-alcohol oxidase